MIILKPCPLCGGDPYLSIIPTHTHKFFGLGLLESPQSCFIECLSCGCSISDKDKDVIIKKWNTRNGVN